MSIRFLCPYLNISQGSQLRYDRSSDFDPVGKHHENPRICLRSVSDVPGKTAHSGSHGQPGCEWALIIPSCAYSFFSDLFYREGYSAKQIADILQKNEATVRSDLHRGRARLKELLKEEYGFEETV